MIQNYLLQKGWLSVQDTAPQGYSTIYYNGTDHGCTISHDQCYWKERKYAQGKCAEWEECKFIYESDKHPPATSGNPIYWARGDAETITEEGAVLWKQQGNRNNSHLYLTAILVSL